MPDEKKSFFFFLKKKIITLKKVVKGNAMQYVVVRILIYENFKSLYIIP